MCGIVGYVTNEEKVGAQKREKFLRQALIVDTLRGKDSTGVFGVGSESEIGMSPGWCKKLGDGYSFVNSKNYQDFDMFYYRYAVGHNRAATVGDVTVDNAHPFQEGPITLVHNGSLWSTAALPKRLSELDGAEVDSHAICHNLAIATPEEVIPKLDGAFVLVWHDNRDDSLNVVRNDERPFHMAEVIGQETIVFMSEAEMLHAVCKRTDIRLRDIVYPRPGQWLKFLPGDVLNPVVKHIELRPTYNQYNGYGAYSGNGYRSGGYNGCGGLVGGYSDDEDYWDNVCGTGEYARPKHPTPTDTDNRIYVGGRRRAVPMKAQELLLDHDLLVESRITFVPVSYAPVGKKPTGIVSGYSAKDGMTVILYNVPEDQYDRAKSRNWIVRPIAIKYLDPREPAIVAKLVSTLGDQTHQRNTYHTERCETLFDSFLAEEEENERDYLKTVRGPKGVFIPVSEYIDLTCGGCASCTGPIEVYDSDEIIWVNQNRDPICVRCVSHFDLTGAD